jgi:quinol monooxygenase YgiN
MVIPHAQLPIQPEARDRFLAIIAAVTPPSRAEDACGSYALYEAIETTQHLHVHRGVGPVDGLHGHFHPPHFTEFFAALGDLLAAPPTGSISEVGSTQTLDEVSRRPASPEHHAVRSYPAARCAVGLMPRTRLKAVESAKADE